MPGKHSSLKAISLKQLRKLFRISAEAHNRKIKDVTGFAEEQNHHTLSRRKFLSNTLKMTALISVGGIYQSCAPVNDKTQPEIAIIGAGMAGLHAAYILKKAGYMATVYEGSPRIGGRIMSVPEMMGPGLWTEMGGEFIDSTHTDMINLARQFNLPLLDRREPAELELQEFAYHFNGRHYHLKDVLEALHPYTLKIRNDIDSLSDAISYKASSETDKRLDNMSIMEYIDDLGISGWFRNFIYSSYTAEYGMEATDQSAISFLGIFDPGDDKEYKLYGDSDERFSVIGGNLKLCEAMAGELGDLVLPGHFLRAIQQRNDNAYQLTFQINGGGTIGTYADIVLVTLPFSVLREVDIKVALPNWKLNSIRHLGYGTNSKLFVGVNERVWRQHGYGGYAFSDNGMMNGYDNTHMQTGNKGRGGYTIAPGGRAGMEVAATDVVALKDKYVTALDGVFPGIAAQFNNNFQFWSWPGYAYSKASYTAYKTGQYTTMAGSEFEPIENLFFAGEHCSQQFQGFMNGAAETGRRAAEAIVKKMRS